MFRTRPLNTPLWRSCECLPPSCLSFRRHAPVHSSSQQARPCLFACSCSPAPDSIHVSYVSFLPCLLPHRAHVVCLPALQRRHRVSLHFVHVVCSPSSSSFIAVLCPTAPPHVFDVNHILLHPTRRVHTVFRLVPSCRLSNTSHLFS